jgi:hypothetical protein
MVSVLDIRASDTICAHRRRGSNKEGKLEMMTQSEAEKQITRILAQLEKDMNSSVNSISIQEWDDGSTLIRTRRKKGVSIFLKEVPHIEWNLD